MLGDIVLSVLYVGSLVGIAYGIFGIANDVDGGSGFNLIFASSAVSAIIFGLMLKSQDGPSPFVLTAGWFVSMVVFATYKVIRERLDRA